MADNYCWSGSKEIESKNRAAVASYQPLEGNEDGQSMTQCVPDWEGEGGAGGVGGYSLDVPGCGGLVLRDGRTDGDTFCGTPDDVWPWWDWDLDEVAELKWVDGQPRVQASKPPTPTRTGAGTGAGTAGTADVACSLLTDTAAGDVEDFDLERWLCTAAGEERRPAADVTDDLAADAIVPCSTGGAPGPVDSASCPLVPDMQSPGQVPPDASCGLGTARQGTKRPSNGRGGVQQGPGKRHCDQQPQPQPQTQPPRQEEDLQVACSHKDWAGQRLDDNAASVQKAKCRSAISERKRRDRFNQKIRTLQKLVPNCEKVDKVSILDEVIAHVRQLQAQAQMHMVAGMGAGLSVSPPPMMMPTPASPMAAYMQQQLQIMAQMAAQMSQIGFRMGLAGTDGGLFPRTAPPLLDLSSRPLIPLATAAQQMIARSDSGSSVRGEFARSFPY